MKGQPSCEVTYALSRAMTPPSMARMVPPAPVPPPGPAYSQAAPPPPAAASPSPSQQEWKQAIIAEAQRYCEAFPKDPICHFKDQPVQ